MCVCVYFDVVVVVVVVVVNNDCCVGVELLLHQLLMLIIFLFTEENILCAISDLLFAHIGNIGVVLSWAVVYMIRYPEIQRKCREEIKQVVASEKNVCLSDKAKLTYVQATSKEILRIAATGPRNCLGEFLAEMEIFLLFSSLIQNFTFSKASPSDDFDFEGNLGLLMTPPDFKVKIAKI
ncbi:hypothetical protein KUTeg_009370 [Tegillarca granosa]|uniref:Cytochrome P450 n=1 Tax=Tegillarca granosa TaxID=220873 RepID=A0ABQ9F805_TEGGR|nr:hypothetical protein KUTeg_009370 [Tegillarca granosa]